MKDAGYAHMGAGSAKGVNKAEDAANAAISSPFWRQALPVPAAYINITSSPDIGLDDGEKAATLVTNSAHPEANIIWGAAFDETLKDEMVITVVATGFDVGAQNDGAAVPESAGAYGGNYTFVSEKTPVQAPVLRWLRRFSSRSKLLKQLLFRRPKRYPRRLRLRFRKNRTTTSMIFSTC